MHSTTRRGIAVTAVAGLLVSALAACSTDTDVPSPSTSPGDGRLTIGIPFDEPGLGFKSGDTFSGFDVETAKYVAKSLGVKPENITWVEANPGKREDLLTSGQVDLVVATYSITDERKQKVGFAGPYFVAHQDLLIRRNDETIDGPRTLNDKTLCSVNGTTSAARVKERFKGKITLQEYPKYSECVEALMAGDVDAVTTDDVILAGYAAQEKYKGKLRVVGNGFSDENYGVGVKKGDTATAGKVTAALQEYIDSGAWKKALRKTVGASGYEIPSAPKPVAP